MKEYALTFSDTGNIMTKEDAKVIKAIFEKRLKA